MKILSVNIQNYKSIRNATVELGEINILIGANGAGKSNFISWFKLLHSIIENQLQLFTARNGGAENILYFGRKWSSFIESEIEFDSLNGLKSYYRFKIEPSADDRFYFAEEKAGESQNEGKEKANNLAAGNFETGIHQNLNGPSQILIANALSGLKVYHFHDTSESAQLKQKGRVDDNRALRENASNLAAFLYFLETRHPGQFRQIQNTVRLIAPFFDAFQLKPDAINEEFIRLEWREKGSDKYFNASNLSDGTLRMICLATLLLQPEPPDTIIIDEPELGLHPAAIEVLTSLIKSASRRSQIIISTQSVTLINHFLPENILVADRKDGQSTFERIEATDLEGWKEDYSLGDVWEKNIIGGRP
ncbi:MAG: AAA family ATPase [Bacteroidia bacterium]|nr:AAA family ATPase [Bacteroidia bacterium]